MKNRALLTLIAIACLALGGAATIALVRRYGWGEGIDPGTWLLWLILAPMLLALNLSLRFLRWRLLLRSAEINLPERLSFKVYLTSFAFNFTPLYLGPTLYRVLALSRFSTQSTLRRKLVGVSVAEVFYDAAGLAVIGLIGALMHPRQLPSAWPLVLVVMLALLPPARKTVAVLYCVIVNAAGRWILRLKNDLPPSALAHAFSTPRFLPAIAFSIIAWTFPALFLASLLIRADDPQMSSSAATLPIASRAMAEATLAGSLSAAPGGTGVTGTLLYRRLESLGSPPSPSTIFLYRLGTYWLSIAAGAVAGLLFLRRERALGIRKHFEAIASIYDAQIPEHVRDRLIQRKAHSMLARLSVGQAFQPAPLKGLDLGCGQGHYAHHMRDHGFSIIGIDASVEQLRSARERIDTLAASDAVRLPFADQAFDFIYSINVLHHLPDRTAQRVAFSEIQRVLKPGGHFFLHEINTINPLFRFYMGYVFPILREIDTGEEHWIRPDRWEELGAWRPREIDYYTFLPDFVPESAAKMLRPLEQRLERSRWKHMSAHYTAVFVKE